MSETIRFHSAYRSNLPIYERHHDWVESTPEALAEYLVPTMVEKEETLGKKYFRERVDHLDTDNDIFNLLTVHFSDLTKDEPTWGGLDGERAKLILKNIDGKRTSAWKQAKEIIWQLLWAGVVPIEAYAPAVVSGSAADAKANNERSYARIYEPWDLVDWAYFDDEGPDRGKLQYVVFRSKMENFDGKEHLVFKKLWIEPGGRVYYSQRYRSAVPWAEKLAKKDIDVVPHEEEMVGELPFIPVHIFGDPEKGVKRTSMYRATNDAKVLLNTQSLYDRICRYLAFVRTIIAAADIQDKDRILLSEAIIGTINDPDAKVFNLPASDPVPIWKNRQRISQSIKFKMLFMSHQAVNPESKEAASVESKRADQESRKNYYNDLTDEVEFGLNYLYGTVLNEFEGRQLASAGTSIMFKRNFELKDYVVDQQEKDRLWLQLGSFAEAGVEARKRIVVTNLLDASTLR